MKVFKKSRFYAKEDTKPKKSGLEECFSKISNDAEDLHEKLVKSLNLSVPSHRNSQAQKHTLPSLSQSSKPLDISGTSRASARGFHEQKVEEKIAIARMEKDRYLEKLEQVESKSKAKPLPKIANTTSNPLMSLFENKNLGRLSSKQLVTAAYSSKELSKHEEARSRREKLQEIEQSDRILRYSIHHENRPAREDMVRCFESSKRQRFFLQTVFLFHFFQLIASHKHADQTTVGGNFRQKQYQKLKIQQAKEMLEQLEKKRDKTKSTKLNRTFLLFLVKWRLSRRRAAANFLAGYLKLTCFHKSNLKKLFLRVKRAVRIVQRNFHSLKACREARLFAMKLKILKALEVLKIEAEEHKKKYGEYFGDDVSKLTHPKYGFDLNLSIEGEKQNSIILMFIDTKKKEWVAHVDFKRKQAKTQTFDLTAAHSWLCEEFCETIAMDKAFNNLVNPTAMEHQFSFTFQLYTNTTHRDLIKLIQMINDAKYATEKSVREQLKSKARVVSNASKVVHAKKRRSII